ncbi:MAG: hypothetical protein AAFX85_20075, partial [Pseudomonadota bacterium]
MEWVKFLLGLGGIALLFALPFAVLFWIVRQFYRGIRAKVSGLTELVPAGVTTTGTITRVDRDRTGEHLRTYSHYEYFDGEGKRYTGQIG